MDQATGNPAGANAAPQPKFCEGLHAAYEAMRAEPSQEKYIAMLEALEADVKAGALGFLPVDSASPEDLKKEGAVKWCVANTQQGPMLSLFTSHEQVAKHTSPAHVGISLTAFVQQALQQAELKGVLVNPLDGQNGIAIERKNLEVLARRLGAMPQMPRQIVSDACLRLFEIAVGVPCPVYDIQADLAKIGGPDALLKPVMEKWNAAIADGSFRPASGEEYVKTIVKDAMTIAFVSGALVRKDPALVRDADPAMCLDAVPYLKDDLAQNTDELLIVLSELVRKSLGNVPDAQLWNLLAANVGVISFGASCFGFGWGIAKYVEGLGAGPLDELRAKEREFRRKIDEMRQAAIAKAQAEAAAKAEAEKGAEAEKNQEGK